jgi:hypothetical protein
MVTIILAQVPCKDSLPCFVCLFVCCFFFFEEAWSARGWQGGLMEEEEDEEEHGHCCWLKDKVLGFRV